ncbi:phosphatase PAP2 family protein [Embleya scabrispora]|uniref:Phosphatase PAP2 family protein n=1 Tax=Embleya scabrispora TaxID=159449 RepID=A0A1T3NJR6_9ACTN|nr:phosphatase PAP2 family protein [Embleya scabrispora]OPC77089.1 phosphatase PAP2 family protein [Embleya scabrispora]
MRMPWGTGDVDRAWTRAAASRVPAGVGRVLSEVEEAAESSKLWCAAAAVMAATGGRRGCVAAAAGLSALVLAQVASNGLCKRVVDRPRPPKEWIPHDEVEDRPDSSSFPSGHTAAAVAFTTAVAPSWPGAAAVCALPAAMVALERVQSGAHYPTDVAAGAAVGLAAAWLVRRAPRILPRRWIPGVAWYG